MNIKGLIVIKAEAQKYLQENPERFNKEEKEKFLKDLNHWLTEDDKAIDDDVYDFLVNKSLVQKPTRATTFARYICKKYSSESHKNILDVGAGRMCHLSRRLERSGFVPTAIDPIIRLSQEEATKLKINNIITSKFYCDEYYEEKNGFDIRPFDLVIGLEPCDATEHIIRQGLKYDKPFEVMLCYTVHKALDNTKCKTVDDWYNYLKSISSEVKINEADNSFIATNN